MWRQLLVYFSILSLLLVGSYAAHAAGVHGVLRVVKGKVQIKSGRTNKTERAKVGQKVFPQDTIITGSNSRAKIVMIDDNEINVSPESEIVFEKYVSLQADALFFSTGHRQQSSLAKQLGCSFTKDGCIRTNRKQQTGVKGVFVAGDAAKDMQFVIVAAAEGAKAAVMINTELTEEERAHTS